MKDRKVNKIITYSLVVIIAIFACFCITSIKATKLNDKVNVYGASSDLVTIQFKDVNMCKAVKRGISSKKIYSYDETNMTLIMTEENIASITYLSLYDRNIKDISGIEKFTNLKELSLGKNQISDISALSSLTNLTELYLQNNQISDISALNSLTRLTELRLDNNQISDVSALSTLIYLDRLDLRNNQISDVSALSTLKNLYTLYLENNQISDISPLYVIHVFRNSNVRFSGNKSTGTVSRKVYKLPSIIVSRNKDLVIELYSPKDLILVNCTLSEDGESIILNPNLKKGDTVIIKLEDFVLDGKTYFGISHTLTVDDAYIDPPIPTITYSKTEQTNEDVTATISFNKEGVTILNNEGKNTYDFTQNGEFTFEYEDENGNKGNAKAIVNNIDKEIPVGKVTYKTTDEGVIATITFNKEGVKILNNDGKNTYTFKENGEFTFEFEDMLGNKGKTIATVKDIVKDIENSDNNDNNDNNNNNNNSENVNTGDNIIYFSIVLVIAVLCIIVTRIGYFSKGNLKK